MSNEQHLFHPVGPHGYCVWLDWCTRPECKRPATPWELIAAGGEWTFGAAVSGEPEG